MPFEQKHIVFYDGVCGLCNKLIQYLIKYDKHKRLFFSPLSGEAAQLLPQATLSIDSLVFVNNNKIHLQSGAALRIFYTLGGWHRLLIIFWLVPYPIRDWVYNRIAKTRYQKFGKLDVCPMPSKDQAARFLA